MAKVQFFSQQMIESWAQENKVEFDGQKLTILVEPKAVYRLEPAFRFLQPIEGHDQKGIGGKVLTQAHLDALGADVYLDSALVGEIAYKIEHGYVVRAFEEKKKDEEILADFMLQALSKKKD